MSQATCGTNTVKDSPVETQHVPTDMTPTEIAPFQNGGPERTRSAPHRTRRRILVHSRRRGSTATTRAVPRRAAACAPSTDVAVPSKESSQVALACDRGTPRARGSRTDTRPHLLTRQGRSSRPDEGRRKVTKHSAVSAFVRSLRRGFDFATAAMAAKASAALGAGRLAVMKRSASKSSPPMISMASSKSSQR